MSSRDTTVFALRRDLHNRIKRLFSTITLAGGNPPSIFEFVNGAIEQKVSKQEKKYGVRPAA